MIQTVMTAFLGAAGGTIFTALLIGFKRIGALTQAIKALSHDALFARCEMLLQREFVTTDDLENLTYLYDAYQKMGLNGTGTELYNRAKSLPLK